MRRKRLIYARRVMAHGPPALQALFQCRVGPGDEPLPWVRQLLNDLCHLQRYHGEKLREMPDPRQQPKAWTLLIVEFPQEWRELVNSYTEYENPCTSSVLQPHNDLYEFSCNLCVGRPAFKSAKALASHMRTKHKVTNPLSKYVDVMSKHILQQQQHSDVGSKRATQMLEAKPPTDNTKTQQTIQSP